MPVEPEFPKTELELTQWIKDGVEESLNLDYKQKEALSRDATGEIAKDVSAMANAAGGILIYGVAEYPKDSPKKHLPERIDPVDETKFSKEWLERAIGSGIRPRIPDVLVNPIRLAGGGSVYVVVVPQGTTAHQAAEKKRYYRRYNFESVPMEDHEIRDTMNRVRHPQVRLSFRISFGKAQSEFPTGRPPDPNTYRWLHVSFSNVGERLANYSYATLWIPVSAIGTPRPPVVEYEGKLFSSFNLDMSWPERSGTFQTPTKISDPLLPGFKRGIRTIRLIPTDQELPDESLVYGVYADEAPKFAGSLSLTSIETETDEADDADDGLIERVDTPP